MCNIMSLKRIDTLSADILDEDFIKVFQPMHLMQRLLGFHRVKIEYRFVTETSIYYKFYSCAVWFLNILCFINKYTYCYQTLPSQSVEDQLKFALILNGIFNTIIAWQNNFSYGNLNGQLYVKLQKIDRDLKLNNSKHLNNKLAFLSLILTIFVVSMCVGWILLYNVGIACRACTSTFIVMFLAMPNAMEMLILYIISVFLMMRIGHVNKSLWKQLFNYASSDGAMENRICNTVNKAAFGLQDAVVGMYSIIDAFLSVVSRFRFAVSRPLIILLI